MVYCSIYQRAVWLLPSLLYWKLRRCSFCGSWRPKLGEDEIIADGSSKELTVTCIVLLEASSSILFLGSLRSAAFPIYADHLLCCPNGFDLGRFPFRISVTNDVQKNTEAVLLMFLSSL